MARRLKRELIEAAVRENEAQLGRVRLGAAAGRWRRRRRRGFSPWRLLLLAPVAAAAGFGYLEARRWQAEFASEAPVGMARAAPETRFVGPSEPLDLDVFLLPVRRIVLDPGHGGDAFGAQAAGLAEKDLALDIASRARQSLADTYQVVMTREADLDVALDRRSGIANRAGADLFVSIHVNWLPGNRTCGIETYYLGPTDDPEIAARAERENAEAHGYSLADLRWMLDEVYARAMEEQSRALAVAVQGALFERLGITNPKLRNRGVKSAPLLVLIAAEMPAILTEVSCLSDAEEVERLREDAHRQAIAEALGAGIRRYAKSLRPQEPPTAP